MKESTEVQLLTDSLRVAPERLAPRTSPELAAGVIAAMPVASGTPFLIGHERAARAIDYALAVDLPGYNLFVMGPKGIGKSLFVREAIQRQARKAPTHDWVYLNNFASADHPQAFGLQAGDGARLRDAMRETVRELRATLPAAFEAESYATEIERVQSALAEQQNAALQAIHEEAMAAGIALLQTPNGLSFAPMRDGEVMPPEVFNALKSEEQEAIRKRIRELEEKLQRSMRETMRHRREQVADIERINRETARFATEQAIDELRDKFPESTGLHPWFDALQADLLEHFELFLPQKPSPEQGPFAMQPDFGRYEVNLLTESCDGQAPVVMVDHPTMPELVGRVEYRATFGMLNTDFRLIKPGKLHLANGGYLLIDAWRLVAEPYAWDALKRTLQRAAIRIESPAEAAGYAGTARLEPEPIPLSVKVVIFGERYLYHLLSEHDPEFGALFRVVADFDDALPRDHDHVRGLASVVMAQATQARLMPMAPAALARLLDEAARSADDNQRLSAHVQSLIEIAVESDHEARRDGATQIERVHVRRAVASARDRMARSHREYQNAIERGVLLIDTLDRRVGQVNGLAVYDIGGQGFGHPSRITATTRFGDGNLLDIQRETHMGGAIHTKGVMILTSMSHHASPPPASAGQCDAELRTELRAGRRRQCHDCRDLRIAVLVVRYATAPGSRGHRFDEPTRRGTGGRRGESQDRRLLRCLQGARPDRHPGCRDAGQQCRTSDARRRGRGGSARWSLPHLCGRACRPGSLDSAGLARGQPLGQPARRQPDRTYRDPGAEPARASCGRAGPGATRPPDLR
ncbi:MAG: ATP-binding protein [Burkholderiaceae bacterium]